MTVEEIKEKRRLLIKKIDDLMKIVAKIDEYLNAEKVDLTAMKNEVEENISGETV